MKSPPNITDNLPASVEPVPGVVVTEDNIAGVIPTNSKLKPDDSPESLTKFDDDGKLMTNPDAILAAIDDGQIDGTAISVKPDMIPLPVIHTEVEGAEGVGAVRLPSVRLDLFADVYARDVKLLKIKTDGKVEVVTKVASASNIDHARFLLTDDQGNPVPDDEKIKKGVNYLVTVGIRDNSDYDWNDADNVIVDPMALAVSENSSSSSGGCSSGAFGLVSMLTIAAVAARITRRREGGRE
jgi:hypothetical protein